LFNFAYLVQKLSLIGLFEFFDRGTEFLSGEIKSFNGTTETFSEIVSRPWLSRLLRGRILPKVKSTPLRVAVAALIVKVRPLSSKSTRLNNKMSTVNIKLSLATLVCVLGDLLSTSFHT